MQHHLRPLLAAALLLTHAGCDVPTERPGLPSDVGAGGAPGDTETTEPPVPLVTPDALVIQPGGGRAFLLDAIGGARTSIRAVSYLLTDDAVENALIAAKARGVEVRVIVPFELTSNDEARGKLSGAGVEVRDGSPAFALTHEKAVVVDDDRAFVLTQNLTYSGFEYNREYDLSISGSAARDVAAIFDADWSRQPYDGPTDLVVSPVNSRSRLVALLRSAAARIELQMEVLNDGSIIDLLAARARSGIDVRVLLQDPAEVDDNRAAATRLEAAGVQVRWLAQPELHAKALVVDEKYAYAGSINFTYASLDRNREVGLITGDPAAVARIADTLASDFAKGRAF